MKASEALKVAADVVANLARKTGASGPLSDDQALIVMSLEIVGRFLGRVQQDAEANPDAYSDLAVATELPKASDN